MDWRVFYRDVLPFCALISVQCTEVGVNILFKAATLNGLSYYVFIVYSYAVSTLVLLFPLPFIFHRSSGLPSFKLSVVCRIFLLGLLGYSAVLCGYTGIEYSSPTLASAVSNLGPAFTFILAVFFRMEKATLRSSSTQAKIIGSVVSISGALIVVLFKGPTILSATSSTKSPSLDSSQRDWVLGGFLLAVAYVLMSIWYIALTYIIKQYPAELIVVFLYNLCATIISAPVCLLVERNLSAWRLVPDIALVAIIYSGLFSTGFSTLVHTWGLHLKGPVYVSIFKPLSIAIAVAMSFIFLGDALYLGSVVGAVILSIGFYAVIWGKAKEEEFSEDEDYGLSSSGPLPNSKTPLLQNYKGEYR